MKKISIIIPVFNETNNLTELVDSIYHALGEYHDAWEIVFVDDGSDDGSFLKLKIHRRRGFTPNCCSRVAKELWTDNCYCCWN